MYYLTVTTSVILLVLVYYMFRGFLNFAVKADSLFKLRGYINHFMGMAAIIFVIMVCFLFGTFLIYVYNIDASIRGGELVNGYMRGYGPIMNFFIPLFLLSIITFFIGYRSESYKKLSEIVKGVFAGGLLLLGITIFYFAKTVEEFAMFVFLNSFYALLISSIANSFGKLGIKLRILLNRRTK